MNIKHFPELFNLKRQWKLQRKGPEEVEFTGKDINRLIPAKPILSLG